MSLVIAEISYTNILPMFYYVDREKLKHAGCEFVPAIPSQLNQDMADGKVHVGGISSFAYGEHSEEYQVLPDLSVSAMKQVGSIFLFSKKPIEELGGASIALTSSSATSVNLLKIILSKFYQLNVTYTTMAPNYSVMMNDHDACLLIGDDAILTSFSKQDAIYQYDLGCLWKLFTGFPMTFALFAIRKEAWEKHGELLAEVHRQFLKSKLLSRNNRFSEMITSIRVQLGGTTDFWQTYFAGLNYELTETHLEGLHHFYDLAYELNLLTQKVNKVSIWNPTENFHSV
ncbi:menaquinone biosynthesis protein [Salipaludibacillus sp. LMS25]|jgi:chorismate dehydratase|uniref:menaquinone biosynthesis protein n=1 Tax=Salipaludibacillus sp. LMS25 TaxID=2924031 RepID=UPI0020D004FC|nr:menaquinone biosynthesis protein [Salipaludibacillus sp. LMS25]UTR14632.1 menaquinone biosynthesis protein [Salipaludibacillus sp. LMS25]